MINSLFILDVNGLRRRFHRRLAEWQLAFVMLLAGLTLLVDSSSERPDYVVIRENVDQTICAVAMLALAGVRIVVLIINGALRRRSPHMRAGLASLSSLVWFGLLAGFMAADRLLLINAFLAVAVIVEIISAYRAAKDARIEDDDLTGAKAAGGDVK